MDFEARITFVLLSCLMLECASAGVIGSTPESGSLVTIKQGTVQGTIMQTTGGRDIHAFRGIPFGNATERFKEAVPAGPWTDVLNATTDAPACKQYDSFFKKTVFGVEDCLTLSVYTPRLPEKDDASQLLPVMVFIYGGGFIMGDGSSKTYGPDKFLNNDIVLVVIQYRVGPFGFLSTHDEASSGNYGLLDQNLALKWTKDNIKAFGGDEKKVTIFGESAGGASVVFHLISPLSKGLFHNAIAQSGSVLCPWAIQENPLNVTAKLAKDLNCPTDDTKALVDCLRKVDADDILTAANATGMYTDLFAATVPVVENVKGGKFLTESPWKLFKEGRFNKVPTIIGVTEDEGSFVLSANLTLLVPNLNDSESEFRGKSLPKFIDSISGLKNDGDFEASVKEKYFKDLDYANKSSVLSRLSELTSDTWFKGCSDSTARYIAAQGVPVYLYVFDYVTPQHMFSNITGTPDVAHGQDLVYQFTMDLPPFNNASSYTEEENKFSANFIDMWTNFANISVPTPNLADVQWTPTPTNEIKYLRISPNPKMETGYLEDKLKLWKTKYEDTA